MLRKFSIFVRAVSIQEKWKTHKEYGGDGADVFRKQRTTFMADLFMGIAFRMAKEER